MRFSNTKFQLIRLASLVMLAGLVFMMSLSYQYPISPNAYLVFAPLVVLYAIVTCYFFWRWLAIYTPKRRLLSELWRQCKHAIAVDGYATVSTHTGASLTVRRNDAGTFHLELRAPDKTGVTFMLNQYSLEGCDRYVHRLRIERAVVTDMVLLLRAYNANHFSPAYIKRELDTFYKERARVGADAREEQEVREAMEQYSWDNASA